MIPHIFKEGSRQHVISYHLVILKNFKQLGIAVCSEKDCEINHNTKKIMKKEDCNDEEKD